MKKTVSKPVEEYHEDMKQNWLDTEVNGQKASYDQFGFTIIRAQRYTLLWKGETITKTYSLRAAQEIARILLNDKIMHSGK